MPSVASQYCTPVDLSPNFPPIFLAVLHSIEPDTVSCPPSLSEAQRLTRPAYAQIRFSWSQPGKQEVSRRAMAAAPAENLAQFPCF